MPGSTSTTQYPQASLLGLPPELRLKILRCLFISPSVIRSITSITEDDPRCWRMFKDTLEKVTPSEHEAFLETVQLSSQLLRCCSILRHEGEHLLYQNRLEISLQVDTREEPYWRLLRGHILVIVLDKSYHLMHDSEAMAFRRFVNKFNNLALVFFDEQRLEIQDMCWHIRDICLDKDVTVDCPSNRSYGPAYRTLRCRRLQFGWEWPDSPHETDAVKELRSRRRDETQALIESHVPDSQMIQRLQLVNRVLWDIEGQWNEFWLWKDPAAIDTYCSMLDAFDEDGAEAFERAKVEFIDALMVYLDHEWVVTGDEVNSLAENAESETDGGLLAAGGVVRGAWRARLLAA